MLASLRIRTLFLLLVATVAVLTGVLAWQVNYRLHEHSERASDIFTNNLVPLRAIKQMSDYYAVTVVDTIQKVRNGDLTADAAIAILAKTNAEADLTWNYLREVFHETDSTAIREVPPLLADARQAAETAVTLLRQGGGEALDVFASQALYRAVDPLTRRLNQMAEFNVGRATSDHQELRNALVNSRRLLLGGSLALILTGAAMAFWLQRRIVSPLNDLQHHLKIMAAGDLRQRIGTDQIGEMADVMRALNELQATLAQHREEIEQGSIRLNNILEGTEVGTWQWNLQTNTVVLNEQWAALLGRTLAELQPVSINTFVALTHPDDCQRVMKAVSDHCAGLNQNVDCEIRMKHRDGHWVWILTRGRVMTRTPDGAAEWLLGTHSDISRQKTAFDLVTKLAMVASHTSSAVVITNNQGGVEWINDAFTRMTGYSIAEVSGKRLGNVLSGPRTDRVELARAREQMLTGNPVSTELNAYTRAGKRFYLDIQIQPVHDGNGQISNFVAILNDITERRNTEDRLRRQNELLTHFNRGTSILNGSLESRLRHLLRATAQTLQVDAVSLWDYDEPQQQLVSRAKYDLLTDQFLVDPPLPTAQASRYLETLSKQRRIVSRNVWLDPATADLIEQNLVAPNVVALLDTALFRAGRLTGVLCLEQSYVERNWEHDEQVFVGSVVDLIQVWKEQDEVQQQQVLLEQTGSIANVGGWQLDIPSQQVTWSTQTRRIHEVDDSFTPTVATALAFHDPSTRDRLEQAVAAAMEHGTPWDFEGKLYTARGRTIWVHISGAARFSDGKPVELYGAVQDITHQKEMERNLLATTALLSNVLSSASEVSIIATDPQGTILLFNRGAERMLGYGSEEMVGKQSPAVLHDMLEVEARAAELSALTGEAISGFQTFVYQAERVGSEHRNWTYIRKDGSRLQVSLVVTTMRNHDGKISGYLGIAQDISERARIEQMKNEFISTVSHELRTPLTSINGALKLMASGVLGELPDQIYQLLAIAQSNGDRLSALINDLLDMEKVIAGKMSFQLQAFAVQMLVRACLDSNSQLQSMYQVRFVLHAGDDNPTIRVDELRFSQILTNLLSNAAKFSTPNRDVNIHIEVAAGTVRIAVQNHGIGIPASFRNRIFTKFSQADSSDQRHIGGTGLGLAISKELTERMGGRIGFESEENQGALFFVEFDRVSQD